MRLEKFINEGRHTPISLFGLEREDKIKKMANILFHDCKPYLKDLRKSGKVMYRGAYGGDMTKIIPRKNRQPKDMDQALSDELDDAFMSHVGWKPRSEGVFCSGDYEQAKGYGDAVFTVWPIDKYKFVWSWSIWDLYTKMDSYGDDDYIETDWMYEDWEENYGENSDGGSWYYEGDDTEESDKDDAEAKVAGWIIDDQDFESDEEKEDFDPYDEMVDLDWEPNVSEEDYIEDAIADEKERQLENRYEVVFDYESTNIIKAIDSNNEIMVGCKAYYIIDNEYTKELVELLKIGKIKPAHKQLKFQFAYKKRRKS